MEPTTADTIAKAIIEQMKASGHTLVHDYQQRLNPSVHVDNYR